MDTLAQTPARASSAHTVKRRWRNFLLDARFQLKFTAYIVVIALGLSAFLGFFLWRGSLSLMQEAEVAVESRSLAAQSSRDLSTATLNNKLLEHMNDPEFEKQLAEQSRAIDAKYEAEKAIVVQQKAELVRRQRLTWMALVGCLGAFVLVISLTTIVATHRVVGPLFRIKRMAGEISSGRFVVPHALRQGDELQDVFESMTTMVQGLRQIQMEDLSALAATIERAKGSPGGAALAGELQAIEARMRARLS
jgi:methyl-accepting chemotaxis protein